MGKYSLIGINGNAFSVMGYVIKAMKREGKAPEEIRTYKEKAKNGDYNNLLAVSQEIIEFLNN